MRTLHSDYRNAALLIAGARAKWGNDDPRTVALVDEWRAHMREGLRRSIVMQRHWQARVSRRPQRGRHHDSWDGRERYVRADYASRLTYPHPDKKARPVYT
jgi:hypothetical protein